MQFMRQLAEQSIPRSAENIGLAMGALCLVSITMSCSELEMRFFPPLFLLSKK